MDQIISYLPKVRREGKPDEITIDDLGDILGRKYLSRKLKKNLPATIVAARFEGGREIRHIKEFTGLLDIDIDQHDNPDVSLTKTILPVLIHDPHFMHLRVSAGGEGIKAIVKIPIVKSVTEYKAHHRAFRKYMDVTHGIKVDKACDDPTRCAFVNHDEDPYFNEESEPYLERLDLPLSDDGPPTIDIHGDNGVSSVGASSEPIDIGFNAIDDELEEMVDFLSRSPEIYDTHGEWFKLGCAIKSKYGDAGLPYFQKLTAAGDTSTTKTAQKYTPEYVEREYARFSNIGGITFSTMVKMVNEAGWDINESPVIRLSKPKALKIEENFERLLGPTLIGLDEVIEEPYALVKWNEIAVMTLENISVVTGKAKSMKSSFLSGLVVGQILNEKETSINGQFPLGRRGVVIIDTEQTRYHASLAITNAKSVAEQNNIPLYVHAIRELSTTDRVLAVEAAVSHYAGLASLMIIDGIRDLVHSVNNEEEATNIVGLMMRLSSQYKFHIAAVLHQNKSDDYARGHIGTEMMNKSETVISVEAIEDNPGKANISVVYSRGMDPGDLTMERHDDTITLIDRVEAPIKKTKAKTIDQKTDEAMEVASHRYLADYIFTHTDDNKLTMTVFKGHLRRAMGISKLVGNAVLDRMLATGWIKLEMEKQTKWIVLCDVTL